MNMVKRSGLLYSFNGIMLVDKESGVTSFDLVRQIKKVFF